MKRLLAIGLALLFCACATTSSAPGRSAQSGSGETETTCHRISSLHSVHDPVLDETKTQGPTKVIWLNRPNTTMIKTVEGEIYLCDALL